VKILDADNAAVLVGDERAGLSIRSVYGLPRESLGKRLAPGEGLAGQVIQRGEPMLTNDYQGTTPSVWANGTSTPSTPGALDCDDWMSNAHTMFGGQGSMNTTEPSWWAGNGGQQYCDTKLRVICAHK
jgi:hypothetical protein